MGRAAEALGRTQPAISQQVRRLEDILDCSLLRRSASGVVVTPEGEAFLPLAERILALNDEAQAHVRSRAGRGGGRRRIGLLEDIAASGLQMALADFAHVHPELELDVTVADGDAMRDAYRMGKLDLVLSDSLLVGQTPRKRRTCPLVWAAAPSFDLSAREPLPLVLFRHPCECRGRPAPAPHPSGHCPPAPRVCGSFVAVPARRRAGVRVRHPPPRHPQQGRPAAPLAPPPPPP